MNKITEIKSREIIDSRGNPTIETEITISNKYVGRSSVPSGASTGKHEALELRDKDKKRYNGKGVKDIIEKMLSIVKPKLLSNTFENYNDFDQTIINLDSTNNKSNLGANSILSLSLAFAKAMAIKENKNLYNYLSSDKNFLLPVPMINIVNGGSHADNSADIQEFMIAPVGANNFSESIRYGAEIFHSLKTKLKSKGFNTNVGDEGGFAPNINSSKKIIEFILEAIDYTGLKSGKDVFLALDVASSEFYEHNIYNLKGENKKFNSDQMIEYLKDLITQYPIYSIEDGLSEDDWDGWKNLTKEIGNKVQLVGDDLFVTNIERLQKGIETNSGNSILIKLNQIGTLSETIKCVNLAKKNNYSYIISHRSGETEDTSISDLSVALSSGQIKTGSLSRTDRVAKYNQLIRIEEILGKEARFAGSSIL